MKALLAKDAFLQCPDHNKRFDIYCDASELQLGAAILQEGMLVVYYSCKLNSAQHNYTIGEKEILSILETLKRILHHVMVAPIFMSSQTIRIIHSSACRHNVSCDGIYSWMTIPSDSSTSKVTATRLPTGYPVYLSMRGRKPMLCLVIKTTIMVTNKIYKPYQAHARGHK
jgi:RNase H-like domain found in reverse transcriptase